MNAIFYKRLAQALVWVGIFAAFWLMHQNLLGRDVTLALLVAGGLTAACKLLWLAVFRGQPTQMSEHLTTLGGLLAGVGGQKD